EGCDVADGSEAEADGNCSRSSIHDLVDLARFTTAIDLDGCLIHESPTRPRDLAPGFARSVADEQTSSWVFFIGDRIGRVVSIPQREAVDGFVGHILGAHDARN